MTTINIGGSDCASNIIISSNSASIAEESNGNSTCPLASEITKLKHLEQMKSFAINYGLGIDVGLQYFDKYIAPNLGITSKLQNLDVYPLYDMTYINLLGSTPIDPEYSAEYSLAVFDSSTNTTSLMSFTDISALKPAQEQMIKIFNNTYNVDTSFAFNPNYTLDQLDLDKVNPGLSQFFIYYGANWGLSDKFSVWHPVNVTAFVGDYYYNDKKYDGIAFGRAPCKHIDMPKGSGHFGIAAGDTQTAYISWTWFFKKNIDGNMALAYTLQKTFFEDNKYFPYN